jgi:uncharacterized membrane protein YfcA
MTAILLGSLVGLVLGLTGAGGSIFAVPLLVMGLGLNLIEATPIALLAVFGATAFGALTALRARQVCLRAALIVGALGSLVTPAGVLLASRAPERLLYVAFAAVMLIVAARMFLQSRARPGQALQVAESASAVCTLDPAAERLTWSSPCVAVLSLSGMGTGILSGALGVGAGFVIVPALRTATALSMTSVVATSLMAIAIISGGAVVGHVLHGNRIPWDVAAPFLSGALAGMWVGRTFAARLPAARVQQSFAALMAVAAVALVERGL